MAASFVLLTAVRAGAQCDEVVSGLRTPLGITQSNLNNLLVRETGMPSSPGRISIIDTDGNRRTLLDGLPSALNDVGEPSGPSGLFMRGRALYLAVGIGDGIQAGPFPGAAVGNPNPSSPIFSSILALHFSANTERTTSGFTLSVADQAALANGRKVTLADSRGNKLIVEVVANFPTTRPTRSRHFRRTCAARIPLIRSSRIRSIRRHSQS